MKMVQRISLTALLATLIGTAACRDQVTASDGGEEDTETGTDNDPEPLELELVIDHPIVLCGNQDNSKGGPTLSQSLELTRVLTIMPGRYALPTPVVATVDNPWPRSRLTFRWC